VLAAAAPPPRAPTGSIIGWRGAAAADAAAAAGADGARMAGRSVRRRRRRGFFVPARPLARRGRKCAGVATRRWPEGPGCSPARAPREARGEGARARVVGERRVDTRESLCAGTRWMLRATGSGGAVREDATRRKRRWRWMVVM
jgi:hypothetical protein